MHACCGPAGGEKKRNEILQLACLEADMAILDEIDSGGWLPKRHALTTATFVYAEAGCQPGNASFACCYLWLCLDRLSAPAGLDIDALRDVSKAVNGLKAARPDMGILMVTHYKVTQPPHPCFLAAVEQLAH